MYSKSDVKSYRQGYPDVGDNSQINSNIKFYKNRHYATPNQINIDDIHQQWWGNYQELEINHSYIQVGFTLNVLVISAVALSNSRTWTQRLR